MADGKIEIEIELEDGTIKKGFIKTEKLGAKSGKRTGDKFEQGFKRGVGSAFSSLNNQILALGSALALAFGGRAAISAASRQEDAINNLNIALARSGEFSIEASQDIQQWASSLQGATTAGDELLLQMFALSKSFGFTAAQARVATEAALELSVAAGIQLEEATRRVGRTISGSLDDVSKFASGIKDLTKQELAAGKAADVLIKALGGTAAAQINTFSGALAQASNGFGDLLERIGRVITKSPAAIASIKFITKSIQDLTMTIDNANLGDIFGEALQSAIALGQGINLFIIRPLELVFRIGQVVIKGLATALNAFIGQAIIAAQGVAAIGNAFGVVDKQAVQALKNMQESVEETTRQLASETGESFGKLLNQDFANQSELFLTNLQMLADTAGPIANQIKNSTTRDENDKAAIIASNEEIGFSFELLSQSINEQAKKIKVTNGQIAQSFIKGLAGGIGKAFNNVGAALANGENAFKAFGDTVIGLFGNLLADLGQGFILQGTARILAGDPGGGALIAAGAALQIFGGFLSAKSGGAAGATGGGVTVGSGGGVAVGPSEAIVQGEPTSAEPQTSVNVIIQGDVLDTDETGIRIVNLLNDAFDKQGVVISSNARFA